MSAHRSLRVAEAVREVVATAILNDVSDPRVRNLTVLGAEVTDDLRYAKVFVTVTGDEREQKRVMHGLQSARGFLQSKIAARLQTRVTPELKFEIDNSARRTMEILKAIELSLAEEKLTKSEKVESADHDEVDGTEVEID
ncbi:MAG: 30S ribosome-binding factor RbfA [Planctomycetota bacterium]|nr:MAG: 30S ribosome-binding factor RbfA [Planctomycetota bacterium]